MPQYVLNSAPSDYINVKKSIQKFELDEMNKYKNVDLQSIEMNQDIFDFHSNKMEMESNGIQDNFKQVNYSMEQKDKLSGRQEL